MELSQLRFFLEVAKSQHITKSAEKLHIAQPSLTQSIHKLEQTLGIPLFVKKGRNVVLTEYGVFLADRIAPILEELDRIPFELKKLAKRNNETLHVNVLAASTLVTEAIIAYRQTHPDVHFQLRQSEKTEHCDLEVTTKLFYGRDESPDEKRCLVQTEKIFLAVPNNEKYREKTSIRLSEVMDEGFLCLSGSRQFRLICDKICRHVGFRPNIIFESDSPAAVINMIASNMGVGFYPEFSWGTVERRHIRLLEIEDAPFGRDIIVSAAQNHANDALLLDFFTFLKDFIGARAQV